MGLDEAELKEAGARTACRWIASVLALFQPLPASPAAWPRPLGAVEARSLPPRLVPTRLVPIRPVMIVSFEWLDRLEAEMVVLLVEAYLSNVVQSSQKCITGGAPYIADGCFL